MRFRRERPAHMIDFLFALSLFCLFALSAFLIVIIGAEAYRSTVRHMEDTYSTRTALSYVTEKIRRYDEEGMTALTELDGHTALVLSDSTQDADYLTYIYSDGSSLMEFTVKEGTQVSARMGEEIIEVQDFSITEQENGFLLLSATDTGGNTVSLYVHLRNSGGYRRAEEPQQKG